MFCLCIFFTFFISLFAIFAITSSLISPLVQMSFNLIFKLKNNSPTNASIISEVTDHFYNAFMVLFDWIFFQLFCHSIQDLFNINIFNINNLNTFLTIN